MNLRDHREILKNSTKVGSDPPSPPNKNFFSISPVINKFSEHATLKMFY